MKLIVFSGFLGAGKTMAILSLARLLLEEKTPGRVKLAIIENEAGQTGIDDKLLEQAGMEVRSLLSGCVCCTLTNDLMTTLQEIGAQYNPEYVIFEPTGLAYPNRIINIIDTYGENVEWIRQITMVDVKRWEKLDKATPALVRGQVSSADIVLLNKCDLAEPAELDTLEARMRELNTRAPIHRIVAKNGIDKALWQEVLGDA